VGCAVKTVFVLFLGLWLFLQAAFARGQQIDGANAAVATELPFKVSRGFLIVVEGQVGSLSKLRFILDTGTSRTVVDKRVARKLGIRGLPSRLLTMRQTFETESAIFSDVRFGPMRATNIPLLIADLSPFTEYTDGADGILGLDMLWGSRISIDFASKKLLVNPGTTAGAPPRHPSKIVCVTITAKVQGYPVRLLVDTGMSGILLYHDRIPRLETGNLRLTELGHSMFVNEVVVQKIRVGNADIKHPKVLLLPRAPAGFPSTADGILGTASLRARWLQLDFSQGNVAWGR
jgi:predicted aspartyl protease